MEKAWFKKWFDGSRIASASQRCHISPSIRDFRALVPRRHVVRHCLTSPWASFKYHDQTSHAVHCLTSRREGRSRLCRRSRMGRFQAVLCSSLRGLSTAARRDSLITSTRIVCWRYTDDNAGVSAEFDNPGAELIHPVFTGNCFGCDQIDCGWMRRKLRCCDALRSRPYN